MADWNAIKTEYITTKTSYRKLAEKYGVGTASVARRAKAEGWNEKRTDRDNKVITKVIQKSVITDAERLSRIGAAAGRALDVAMKAFEDEKQFNRYIVQESTGINQFEMVEREYSKLDTKALRDMTAVLKELTGIMRNVYGLPTQAEAEAQRIAAERLKLEKEKAAAETAVADDVKVVMAGNIESWSE